MQPFILSSLTGGQAIAYRLRTDMALVSGQPENWPDGETRNTAGQGVPDGALLGRDSGAGSIDIDGNEIKIVGSGNWNETGVYEPDGITNALGVGLFFTENVPVVNWLIRGWNDAAELHTTVYHTLGSVGANISYRISGSEAVIGTRAAATDYGILLLLGGYDVNGIPWKIGDDPANFTYGCRYFIKGGVFTNWSLLWADERSNTTPLYPMFSAKNADTTNFSKIYTPTEVLTPATMFPAVYQDETPDLAVHDVGDGDILFDTRVTTPGAGTDVFTMRFRLQDSQNFWNVNMVAGTAGTDLTLHKTTGGVEAAAVATADVDFATTTAYDIRIVTRGDSWFRVYVDGALKLTYNGPDSAFENETEIQLVNGSSNFTPNLVAVWPSTNSAIDAVIAAEAGY